MTARIDSMMDFPEEEERPKRRYRRHHRRRGGCCCLGLIVGLVIAFVVTAALAKTGVVTIPFFSDVFYRVPEVDRVVEIDDAATAELQQSLDVMEKNEGMTVTIAESQLTYVLQKSLASGTDPYFAESVQATINKRGVELFGLLLKPVKVNVKALVVPTVRNEKIDVSLQAITLGNLSVPTSTADTLSGGMISKLLQQVSDSLNGWGRIGEITLDDTVLTITFLK